MCTVCVWGVGGYTYTVCVGIRTCIIVCVWGAEGECGRVAFWVHFCIKSFIVESVDSISRDERDSP